MPKDEVRKIKSSYHEEARYSQVGNFIVEHKLNSRDQARQPRKQVQPLPMHRAQGERIRRTYDVYGVDLHP